MADGRWQMAGGGTGPLRAVLLDCLGTLLRLEPPAPRLRSALAARGIDVSEDAALAGFRAEIAYYLEHHLAGADAASLERLRDACAQVIARSLGLGSDHDAAVREAMLVALRFTPYPDVVPTLSALRADGLRLVVVSNWDCSLARALEAAGLRPLLDGVVTSAEVGAPKPEPAVLRTGLQVAGCSAEEAVLVGDSVEKDVAGARAAGVAAVLLAREGAAAGADRAEDVPAGVPVVRSLEEARSLVLSRR